jgi:hypothetical protein
MKVCKTIKTGLPGFAVSAFAANFFDVNYFTGSWFTANLLSLIFFRENGFSAKQCITVQNTLSPGTLSLERSVQTTNRLEQAEAGRSPALLALRYRYGGFAYPPGILIAVFNCKTKRKRILRGILCIGIS